MNLTNFVIALGLLTAGSAAFADEGKDFVVTVDGTEYAINAGEELTVKGKSGTDVHIALRQNEIGTFHGDLVIFQHSKDHMVTSTSLQGDVKQHLIATNLGSLVIVQEYRTIDPTSLAELMLKQMTKDDLLEGGQLAKASGKRTVKDGVGLEGLTGTVSLKKAGSDKTAHYEVMTGGSSDHGIIVVTRIDSEAPPDDQKMIDLFWNSLSVKY